MQRRSLIGATALLSIASLAPSRLVAAAMNTIDVGPWSFRAPSDWRQAEVVHGIPYLESKDGTKGCYIKALTFGRTYRSATDAAAYVQGVHERNYFADSKAKWEVKQRSASTAGATASSILDLLDASSNYRVLSLTPEQLRRWPNWYLRYSSYIIGACIALWCLLLVAAP